MNLTIPVTEEHIRSGKHNSSTECPVALAIKDYFTQQSRVCLGWIGESVEVRVNGPDYRFIFTLRDMKDLWAWDWEGKELKPFNVVVQL